MDDVVVRQHVSRIGIYRVTDHHARTELERCIVGRIGRVGSINAKGVDQWSRNRRWPHQGDGDDGSLTTGDDSDNVVLCRDQRLRSNWILREGFPRGSTE